MTYDRTVLFNILLMGAIIWGPTPVLSEDLPNLPMAAVEKPFKSTQSPPATAETEVHNPILSSPSGFPLHDPALIQSLKTRPVLIELFTSIDCLFCPNAEQTVQKLAAGTRAVVLACHTDPETTDQSWGREFCRTRQERYSARLSDGLMYTPQLVLNGHVDAVGHDVNDIISGLHQTLPDDVLPLVPRATSDPSTFMVDIPELKIGSDFSADAFMVTFRPPVMVPKTMRQSALRPHPLTRIAHRLIPLGGVSGEAKTISVSFHKNDNEDGFAIFVERSDQKILAAGDYAGTQPSSSGSNPTPSSSPTTGP